MATINYRENILLGKTVSVKEVLVSDFVMIMRKLSNLITVYHLYGKTGIVRKEKCSLCKNNELFLGAGKRRATFETIICTQIKPVTIFICRKLNKCQ